MPTKSSTDISICTEQKNRIHWTRYLVVCSDQGMKQTSNVSVVQCLTEVSKGMYGTNKALPPVSQGHATWGMNAHLPVESLWCGDMTGAKFILGVIMMLWIACQVALASKKHPYCLPLILAIQRAERFLGIPRNSAGGSRKEGRTGREVA